MKLPRLLLCLFAAIALAMPPLAVRGAAPATGPVEMDCPHHAPSHDQGDSHRDTSKQAAQKLLILGFSAWTAFLSAARLW